MANNTTNECKNIYFATRKEKNFTRIEVCQKTNITENRLEKIEYGQSDPHPDEILALAQLYEKPEWNNMYCTNICSIGKKYVPGVKYQDLPNIVLQMLSTLNDVEKYKKRLIEIAMDGKLSDNEFYDFRKIKSALTKVSVTIKELELWIEQNHPHIEELKETYQNTSQKR